MVSSHIRELWRIVPLRFALGVLALIGVNGVPPRCAPPRPPAQPVGADRQGRSTGDTTTARPLRSKGIGGPAWSRDQIPRLGRVSADGIVGPDPEGCPSVTATPRVPILCRMIEAS